MAMYCDLALSSLISGFLFLVSALKIAAYLPHSPVETRRPHSRSVSQSSLTGTRQTEKKI